MLVPRPKGEGGRELAEVVCRPSSATGEACGRFDRRLTL